MSDTAFEAKSRKIAKALGENMRVLRAAKGWRQEDLAERMGIHRITVVRMETGEQMPAFDLACHLADALGVRVDRLAKPLRSVTRVD